MTVSDRAPIAPGRLHPAVSWHLSDSEVIVAAPDGARVRFTSDLDLIVEALRYFADPVRPAPDIDSAKWQQLHELFGSKGWLVAPGTHPPSDWYSGVIDFFHRQRPPPPNARQSKLVGVAVSGDRDVAAIASASLADHGVPMVDRADSASHLELVCGLASDHALYRAANRAAVVAGRTISFVRVSSLGVLAGPWVVPTESACYECYLERLANGAQPLFRGATDHGPKEEPCEKRALQSPLFRKLIGALAAQHVTNILGQAHAHVGPGSIYGLSALDLASRHQPVLKLPRCVVCGRARASTFARAIRDVFD